MVQPTPNAQQFSVRKSVERKVPCPSCSKLFHPNSLSLHIRTKHTESQLSANISPEHHLRSVCIDPSKGIYLVRKSFSGGDHVLHVQFKTSPPQSIKCTSSACKELSETAGRSGETGFLCVHLKSVAFSEAGSSLPPLEEASLNSLVYQMKWLKPERVKECKDLQAKALQAGAPLIVRFPTSSIGSSRYRHFSVFANQNPCPINRVVVTFDSETLMFTSKCCSASFCVHRNVSKWFIKQQEPVLLDCIEEQGSNNYCDISSASSCQPSTPTIIYPPNDKELSKKMLTYMYNFKKLPPDLPINLTVRYCDYKRRLEYFQSQD